MPARSILDFFREHNRGKTIDTMSDELQAMIDSVVESGRTGSYVISIKMTPAGKEGAYSLAVETSVKPPKKAPEESLFFLTPENHLTKQHPQYEFEVAAGPTLAHKGVA